MEQREIKFRGYSYSKQSWLYGNLIEKDDPTQSEAKPWVRLIHDRALTAELVAFDSVGQYTGLRDKNGKEIYEGDIVSGTNGRYIHIVRFVVMGFYMIDPTDKNETPMVIPDHWEIIGNIYENPDLLK